MRMLSISFAIIMLCSTAGATTFEEGHQPDPFVVGAECNAPELMSTGSYVFNSPSKYDFVFEPFLSLIWRCPSSGYISYANDFDDLSDTEKSRIAAFLGTAPWREEFNEPKGFQVALDQMEAIYELRNRTREKRAYLYRARAWLWGDDAKADAYRTKALTLHKEILAIENPQGWDRIVNLYVVGFYTWKLGDPNAAEPYFAELSKIKWTDEDGKRQRGSEYIEGLIAEIREGEGDDAVRFAQPENPPTFP